MNFPFKTRLGSNDISILVSKDMSVQEMLDALSLAHQITPFSQIVGFRDPSTGLIVPPSLVCQDPDQINKGETYEVMIRQASSQQFQSTLGSNGNNMRPDLQQSVNNTQLGETQTSFMARMGANIRASAAPNSSSMSPAPANNEFSSYRGEGPQSSLAQPRPSGGGGGTLTGGNQAQNFIRE